MKTLSKKSINKTSKSKNLSPSLSKQFMDKELTFGANNYSSLPVVISKAKGSVLTDIDGKTYIDMMSAYSAASLGHANPEILKAMTEQVNTLGVTSRAFYNDKLPLMLEQLSTLSTIDGAKAIPMNSGAEAVETALKVSRRWGEMVKGIKKNKAEIIVCKNNFHGRTLAIISFSTNKEYKDHFGPFVKGFKEVPFNDIKALKKAINKNTCAFLVEPIQGEAGIIVPSPNYLKEVSALCAKKSVLLICDEIQSGLSRTGKLFCFEHSNIKPDVLIVGKALGGGIYPVSAVIAKPEVMNLMEPGSHGSTFGGNPVASSIALKSLELLSNPKLLASVENLGKWSLQYLKKHLSEHIESGLVKDVRGSGLFMAVEFKKGVKASSIVSSMLECGVITKDTHKVTIRLAPALTITKEQLKAAFDCLVKAVDDYAQAIDKSN